MNLKLPPRFYRSLFTAFLVCGIAQWAGLAQLMAGNSNGQSEKSVKQIAVTLDFENDHLEDVFFKIEEATQLSFVYQSSILREEVRFNGKVERESLYNVLLDIAEKANVSFFRKKRCHQC